MEALLQLYSLRLMQLQLDSETGERSHLLSVGSQKGFEVFTVSAVMWQHSSAQLSPSEADPLLADCWALLTLPQEKPRSHNVFQDGGCGTLET